jgi:hypothetical protein
MLPRPKTMALILCAVAIASCNDDEKNRPYMNIEPQKTVALDPDSDRIEHRQLVASLSPAVPAAPAPAPAGKTATVPNSTPAQAATTAAQADPVKLAPLAPPTPIAPTPTPVASVEAPAPGQAGPTAAPAEQQEPKQLWTTTPGVSLRRQIALWIDQTNGEYRLAPKAPDAPGDPPWKLAIQDHYDGDFLGALTWLESGFWQSPRPDVEVTRNNVVVLRTEGDPQ